MSSILYKFLYIIILWKKKLKEYKGKFKNYSIRKKLNYEKRLILILKLFLIL